MKKRYLLLNLLLILIILPVISAITIDLSQESYQPGELLQAEITGNFVSFESENILLYQGDKVHSTPVISDLTNQNNVYYFFAILPYEQGNYSIRIEDAEYVKSGEIIDDMISENFTILESNRSALSINPGFVLTSEDFTIDFKSVYGNLDIVAAIEGGESKDISLIEELEETISFSIEDLAESTILSIQINEASQEDEDEDEKPGFWEGLFGGGDGEITGSNSYNIPVFIIGRTQKPEPEPIENNTNLIFVPESLIGNVTPAYPFKIFISNSGTKDIEDIIISTESNLTLINNNVDLLRPGKQHEITVIIPEDLQKNQKFGGTITATFGKSLNKSTKILPFNFEIIDKTKNVEIQSEEKDTLVKCEDLKGTICESDEECSIIPESSSEGPCCGGICEKEKTSSTGMFIGFLIIIIILVVVFLFYFKSKKKLKPKSTEQILKEKGGKFRERMEGSRNNEVSGGLDRV
jgi:hypothetical protein